MTSKLSVAEIMANLESHAALSPRAGGSSRRAGGKNTARIRVRHAEELRRIVESLESFRSAASLAVGLAQAAPPETGTRGPEIRIPSSGRLMVSRLVPAGRRGEGGRRGVRRQRRGGRGQPAVRRPPPPPRRHPHRLRRPPPHEPGAPDPPCPPGQGLLGSLLPVGSQAAKGAGGRMTGAGLRAAIGALYSQTWIPPDERRSISEEDPRPRSMNRCAARGFERRPRRSGGSGTG